MDADQFQSLQTSGFKIGDQSFHPTENHNSICMYSIAAEQSTEYCGNLDEGHHHHHHHNNPHNVNSVNNVPKPTTYTASLHAQDSHSMNNSLSNHSNHHINPMTGFMVTTGIIGATSGILTIATLSGPRVYNYGKNTYNNIVYKSQQTINVNHENFYIVAKFISDNMNVFKSKTNTSVRIATPFSNTENVILPASNKYITVKGIMWNDNDNDSILYITTNSSVNGVYELKFMAKTDNIYQNFMTNIKKCYYPYNAESYIMSSNINYYLISKLLTSLHDQLKYSHTETKATKSDKTIETLKIPIDDKPVFLDQTKWEPDSNTDIKICIISMIYNSNKCYKVLSTDDDHLNNMIELLAEKFNHI